MTNNGKGLLWALVSTALFSIEAVLAKVLVADYHVLQILFVRQCVVFLSVAPSVVSSFPNNFKTDNPGLHALRLLGAFVALSAGFWAISVLPLTTATTLSFAKVFFVVLLAVWILGEPISLHRYTAVVLGFVGVIVVIRPGTDGLRDLNVLIPLLSAMGAAVAQVCVRRLSQTESTATLLSYQAVFIGLLSGVTMWWLWTTPTGIDLVLLIGIGVLATVGQWIAIKALRLAEASVISNVQYVQLMFVALLGFLVFSEVPDTYTVVGALIIVCSSLYLFHREARRK
jgi:drug/metabolite transporter (DMT)-like permease